MRSVYAKMINTKSYFVPFELFDVIYICDITYISVGNRHLARILEGVYKQ